MPKKLLENNSDSGVESITHNKYWTFYDVTLLQDSKFVCLPRSLTNFF